MKGRGLGWQRITGYTRPVDSIVTSPPYEASVGDHKEGPNAGGNEERYGRWVKGTAEEHGGYTRLQVDSILTSPPYEAQISDENSRYRLYTRGSYRNEAAYTRPVDAVVTSPPYEQAQTGGGISALMRGEGNYSLTTKMPASVYQPAAHGQSSENIGNMRGERYWEAMRQVYAECHRVLVPGGLMVLVLKGFTRDGKYVDLPAQTRTLCEALGFSFVETWQREIWSLSFWRILQKRRDPEGWDERLQFEQVLVLQREG